MVSDSAFHCGRVHVDSSAAPTDETQDILERYSSAMRLRPRSTIPIHLAAMRRARRQHNELRALTCGRNRAGAAFKHVESPVPY